MLRGLISGLFWGTIVGGIAVASASLLSDTLLGMNAPDQTATVAPDEAGFVRDAPEGPATLPDTDASVVTIDTPLVDTPESGVAAPETDTRAASKPSVDGQAPIIAPQAPEVSENTGTAAIGQDDPVLPGPAADAPSAPDLDGSPQINIGAAPEVDPLPEVEVEVQAAPEVTAPEAVNPDGRPAIEAFAEPFDNSRALPVMSLLFIDTPERPNRAQLDALTFPATFVIDPVAPDAAAAMRLYRDAGFEVALLVSLPRGAAPTDAEVAFQDYLGTVTEAVAVVDAANSGFQSNRNMVAQVVDILKGTGHGLVTYSRGLNTAKQLADREDVPAKTIFREFDGKGETPVVMRRFLDQAAFRAAQEAGVLLIGHARPQTISTVVDWTLQGGRSDTVALAPLSITLKQR